MNEEEDAHPEKTSAFRSVKDSPKTNAESRIGQFLKIAVPRETSGASIDQ